MTFPPAILAHLRAPGTLTAEQVAQRLAPVPAFIVINAQGQAITANPTDEKSVPVVGVFLRQKAGQAFLEALQKREPAGAGLKLKAVSLGEVYRNLRKPNPRVSLAFIPDLEEVEQAKKLLQLQGKPGAPQGVPLFMAELPGKGLLNVTQNGKPTVPLFFSLADLMPLVERYNKQRPSGALEAKIVLTSLEFILQNWRKTPDPALSQMQLVVNKAVMDEAKAPPGSS